MNLRIEKEIKQYDGQIEIKAIKTITREYGLIWGSGSLLELTSTITYKNFIEDGVDFVIGYTGVGFYIYRKVSEYISKQIDTSLGLH